MAAQTLQTRARRRRRRFPEADAISGAIADHADDEALEAVDAPRPHAGTDTPTPGNAKSRRLQSIRAKRSNSKETRPQSHRSGEERQPELLSDGFNPIVFCRFIDTAEYVAEQLTAALGKNVAVRAVTGTLPPARTGHPYRTGSHRPAFWLPPTACRGVNLQENFQAVIHYDPSVEPHPALTTLEEPVRHVRGAPNGLSREHVIDLRSRQSGTLVGGGSRWIWTASG